MKKGRSQILGIIVNVTTATDLSETGSVTETIRCHVFTFLLSLAFDRHAHRIVFIPVLSFALVAMWMTSCTAIHGGHLLRLHLCLSLSGQLLSR